MPTAIAAWLMFVTALFAKCGEPETIAWIPENPPSIEFRNTWGLDSDRSMPKAALLIVLSVTVAEDRWRPIPKFAVVIVFHVKLGELSMAMSGRSKRSKVLQETEPVDEALNCTPTGGKRETVLFATHAIGFTEVPSATRRPSTNSVREGSTRICVPGMIVSVTPGRTVIHAVITY